MRKLDAVILVLLIFGSRHGEAKPDCPRGEFYYEIKNNIVNCPANAIIFSTDHKLNCCEDISPCRSGMTVHFCSIDSCKIYSSPIYQRSLRIVDDDAEPFVHAMKEGEDNWFLCPKPIALLYLKQFGRYSGAFPKQYLPVDFEDMNTDLNGCQKHADCEENQFCGNVVNHSYEPEVAGRCIEKNTLTKTCSSDRDCPLHVCQFTRERWTYTDKKHKYCYTLPTIPAQYIDQMKFAMVRTAADLTVCKTNKDCFSEDNGGEFCVDDIIKDALWSMYVPEKTSSNPTGRRETKPGLCMNSKPFAFIYRDFFMDHEGIGGIAQLDKEPDLALPYLPSGYNHREPRFAENSIAKCKLNKDCGKGKFCDYRHSLLLEEGHRKSDLQYCYTVPKLRSQAHPNARHLIDPKKISLFPCDNDRDCPSGGFCLVPDFDPDDATEYKFARFVMSGEVPELLDGICMEGAGGSKPGTPKVCKYDIDCSNDQLCKLVQPKVWHCVKKPKSTTPAASPTPAPPTAPPAQTDPTPDTVQPSDSQTQDPANVPGDPQGVTTDPIDTSGSRDPQGVTTDPSDTSGSTQTGALGASEESDEKNTFIIIIIFVSLLLLLIIIAVIVGIVVMKNKAKNTKKGEKGKKNGKNDGKNNKNKKGRKGKGKGKKIKKTTSSSEASSSTARTGSVGGTGTSTGGYSPMIV